MWTPPLYMQPGRELRSDHCSCKSRSCFFRANNFNIKSLWIGPLPVKPDAKLSANSETNPEFAAWLDKHGLNQVIFFKAVEGKYLQKPYFPIAREPEVVKHTAKVVALCKHNNRVIMTLKTPSSLGIIRTVMIPIPD